MKKVCVIGLAVLFSGALGACGGSPLSMSEGAKLAMAQQQWSRLGWRDYDFEMRRLCFCPNEYLQWSHVEVRAGMVQVVYLLADSTNIAAVRLGEWPTIDGLFQMIWQAEGPYKRIAASYDAVLGYPVAIDFEAAKGVLDAGARYELRGLVAAP